MKEFLLNVVVAFSVFFAGSAALSFVAFAAASFVFWEVIMPPGTLVLFGARLLAIVSAAGAILFAVKEAKNG